MRSVSEAESLILRHVPTFPSGPVPLLQAGGRVLRARICADRPLPPYDRSMMDGIAVRAETAVAAIAAGPQGPGGRLRVEATQFAGMAGGALEDVETGCVRIMTGAVVPVGADCVLPVEWLQFEDDAVAITIPEDAPPIEPGLFIHATGSDRAAGECLVPAGTRLDPPKLAIAAAVGLAEVEVAVQPRVALISTGDELVEPGLPVAPHQIRPSSTFGLAAALQAVDCEPVRMHLPDDREALTAGLRSALDSCDAIVSSGGVSKGGKDFLPAVLAELGVTEHLHRVSQKPGRPMWFGTAELSGDQSRRVPVFALPGNPVSTLVCFRRFVQPAFEQALGLTAVHPPAFAVLTEEVVFRPPLTHFCAVSVAVSADGLRATPVRINTSGDFAALGGSDGFLELPAESASFCAGDSFPFYPW